MFNFSSLNASDTTPNNNFEEHETFDLTGMVMAGLLAFIGLSTEFSTANVQEVSQTSGMSWLNLIDVPQLTKDITIDLGAE